MAVVGNGDFLWTPSCGTTAVCAHPARARSLRGTTATRVSRAKQKAAKVARYHWRHFNGLDKQDETAGSVGTKTWTGTPPVVWRLGYTRGPIFFRDVSHSI
jgi:hypothetical protein